MLFGLRLNNPRPINTIVCASVARILSPLSLAPAHEKRRRKNNSNPMSKTPFFQLLMPTLHHYYIVIILRDFNSLFSEFGILFLSFLRQLLLNSFSDCSQIQKPNQHHSNSDTNFWCSLSLSLLFCGWCERWRWCRLE